MDVGEFKVLQSREDSSMTSMWKCHLCLERTDKGIKLCVKRYMALGFLNELVEFDDEGEYELPDEIDGFKVLGVEGEFIVGDILEDDDGYSFHKLNFDQGLDRSELVSWLRQEGWNPSRTEQIVEDWQRLKNQ